VASKDSDDQLVLLAERLPHLVWFTGPEGYHDYFNQRWYNLTGMTAEQCRGEGWKSAVHPAERSHVDERWRRALATGELYEAEYRLRRADGVYCWMLSRGLAHRGPDGKITRWFGTCTNIDAQKKAEGALALLEEQHRLALESANLGTWSLDLVTRVAVFDGTTCALLQLPPERSRDIPLDDLIAIVHPDDRESVEKRIAEAMDPTADGSYELEYRVVLPNGGIRWIRARGKAFFAEEGGLQKAVRMSGVINDNTRQHALEEAQQLLTRELNHRVKNLFAIANGMVSLTARSAKDTKDMAASLRGRLSALSRAHELVQPPSTTEQFSGAGIPLDQLIGAVLAPYKDTHKDIVVEGPDVRVGSQTTTGLALVLHELATNAAKHGCLSCPEGQLLIRWTIGHDKVDLDWAETNGPPIEQAPTFEGFGTQLTQRSIAGQLGGTLDREWRHEGLCVHMTLPLDRLAG
jgi:PAS domain S-box-containing protein